ncbi:endonuclease/exonuclease/phosphatase family protein [Novosphingobium sp. 1949]|uniref:Endonuclease/exonuclease/phosphatase family protein n=1 Tax=Novosphingobium organovorum TaxID=2930092 RepID=A0ABT0BFK6_9SPHN|nr:endonuclease/exonuclease/phosphatase family protein [Novosphingobium organovorum]MCJ2183850.1 endonuclease/exonuclease/phosphatase family protein [Novosphingobium organovorum]
MNRLYKKGASACGAALVLVTLARPLPAAAPDWPIDEVALPFGQSPRQNPQDRPSPGTLSVMTFNVKGLPFPAAMGRSQALAEIGRRLAALRRAGHEPDVVLLQEAFTDEAKAIAQAAGYPYAALGPDTGALAHEASRTSTDTDWIKGEGIGKWSDSGLMILSDYPITATRRLAFPADMCAGFDCLAAKGVLLAWIALPGQDAPVVLANTHLNARKAAGVGVARANAAYRRQIGAARAFVRGAVAPTSAVIFGGDFNLGHDPQRLAAMREGGGLLADQGREASAHAPCSPCTPALRADLATIRERAKDKQFYRPARGKTLRAEAIEVPLGGASGAAALSDHLGYVIRYRFGA